MHLNKVKIIMKYIHRLDFYNEQNRMRLIKKKKKKKFKNHQIY